MDILSLHRGDAPLLVSLPHDGTHVPGDIATRLTPSARNVPDTDWHVSRLYAFARDLARLAGDERLRASLGAAARADVRVRFAAPSVVERVEQVYRSLLPPRAA